MASSSAIHLLQKACASSGAAGLPSSTTLSSDGRSLTLLGTTLDATSRITLTLPGGKTVTYPLAAVYLQLLHHASVLQYRKACESAGVDEAVKILDKKNILEYFLGSSGDAPAAAGGASDDASVEKGGDNDDMDMSDDEEEGEHRPEPAAKPPSSTKEDSSRHRSGEHRRGEKDHASREHRDRERRHSRDHKEKDHHRSDREKDRERRHSREHRHASSSHKEKDKEKDRERRHSRDSKHRDRHSSSGKDRDRKSSSSSKHHRHDDDRKSKKKAELADATPMTNEQLVANLSTIVDKRDALGKIPKKTDGKGDAEGGGKDEASEAAAPSSTEKDAAAAAADKSGPATPSDPSNEAETPTSTPMSIEDTEEARAAAAKEKERNLLLSWLSPAGFEVDSPAVASAIESDRDVTRRITALEIPVGDSASILRAGAGGEVADSKSGSGSDGGNSSSGGTPSKGGTGGGSPASPGGTVKKRDFARVLEIYEEVVRADEKVKRAILNGKRPAPPSSRDGKRGKMSPGGSSGGKNQSQGGAAGKPTGNPIIIVPNAMTSCITMVNAGYFFGKDATFVDRNVAMKRPDAGKRGGMITVTRKFSPRLGGGEISYDIIDNPTTRLKPAEWNRVVAVVAQGASWQFKGWRYSNPVDLFSRSFGFYVGLEGTPDPSELKGWSVKFGKVSRDRRGLESICLASFWNGLEEFMAVHKQDFLPSANE